jgi:hypothetical protein
LTISVHVCRGNYKVRGPDVLTKTPPVISFRVEYISLREVMTV